MINSLLTKSALPYAAVPFDKIRTEDFLPALESALAASRKSIAAISVDTKKPDFQNTIVALEESCAVTYDIAYVYSNLRHAHGDAPMQALAKEIMPRLIQLESDINLDAGLFARVEAVYKSMNSANFSVEQKTLVEKTYKSFKKSFRCICLCKIISTIRFL
jgi:peptidyl-dipeptidase Dcp